MVKQMGNWLEKTGSLRFWILVAAAIYFGYGLYFAIYGIGFLVHLATSQYVYNLISQNPLWWGVLYYGSEGVAGGIATWLRPIAGVLAVYAAYLFWKKKDVAMPTIRKNVSRALLIEAAFFLMLIPSVIAAFAYNLPTTEYLFYFDHTPERILLYGTAIPCLVIALVVPPLLLKLRASIKREAAKEVILKWSALTGLAYVFVVFWFDYSMLWAASTVPYERPNQLFGWDFILNPTNFVSFAVTLFGLLAIAIAALVVLLPAIKKQPFKVNLTWLGAIMIAFGSYFIFNTIFYFVTGGYEAHPSVWYEVIGPLHNPNLWAFSFVFLGAALIIQSKLQKKSI
jgi:hypothetical protein